MLTILSVLPAFCTFAQEAKNKEPAAPAWKNLRKPGFLFVELSVQDLAAGQLGVSIIIEGSTATSSAHAQLAPSDPMAASDRTAGSHYGRSGNARLMRLLSFLANQIEQGIFIAFELGRLN